MVSSTVPHRRPALSLLFIDIVGFKEITALYGRQASDNALRHVVHYLTIGLRRTDILFTSGPEELIALLSDTNTDLAEVIGLQIREAIHSNPFQSATDGSVELDIVVNAVSCPADGDGLRALVQTARGKTQMQPWIKTS